MVKLFLKVVATIIGIAGKFQQNRPNSKFGPKIVRSLAFWIHTSTSSDLSQIEGFSIVEKAQNHCIGIYIVSISRSLSARTRFYATNSFGW